MSEPPVDATTPSLLLDGELPRLGDSPTPAPTAAGAASSSTAGPVTLAPPTSSAASQTTAPSPVLSAPGSAPVLAAPALPSLPSTPTAPLANTPVVAPMQAAADPNVGAELPSLPSSAPTVHHAAPVAPDAAAAQPATDHPMAHLMPQASAPSEASRRAAEIRAAKKAKARKVKIGVAVGALVVAVVAGPPVGRWVVDAVNEAGSTTTDVDE